ncbi:MAG: NAD-dependent protein deacylase, partial [candidate division Zixibacteria bacterium]|nr:NAD-dependent protein deacylase [candidate division Zixibacteria bacterium]
FGESLPEHTIQTAFERTSEADVFLSVGTSALVHPAASLPVLAAQSGAKVVEINPDATPLSSMAHFCVQERSGECLPSLIDALKARLK